MDQLPGKTILLVEDEALLSLSWKLELQACGYSVITAFSGENAVEICSRTAGIDLILMDINLGKGIDGTQAAEIILRDHDIPVLFLSSHEEKEVVGKTEKITSYGYVVKSSSITVLDASIKMAFRLAEANRKITETRDKLEATLDALPDILYEVDSDGRCYDYHAPHTGRDLPRTVVPGNLISAILPAEAAGVFRAALLEAGETGSSSGRQYNLELPDGKHWFEISVSKKNRAKDDSRFIVISRDVTGRKLVEDELRRSELRFRTLFENANSVNSLYEVVTDAEGRPVDYRYVLVNSPFEKLTGKKGSELYGKTLLEVFPRTESHWLEKLESVARTGVPVRFENYAVELDAYTDLTVYVPMEGMIAMVASDVTERKRAEKALRESEESLSITLQSIGDAVIATDMNGNVVRMNRTAEKLTGWRFEEANGLPLERVFRIINAETRKTVENPVKRVLEIGEVVGLANHTVLVSRDGEEYQIADSASPIRDAQETVHGVILVFSDVTEKYRAEQALRDNERTLRRQIALFQSLLDNLPIGIFMVEAPTGKPLLANGAAARLLGRGVLPDATKENLNDVYRAYVYGTGEAYPPEKTPILLGMSGIVSHIDDMAVVRPDGTRALLEVFGSPVADGEGRIWASLVSFLDITERKIAQEKIRLLLEEKELLLREVHHRVKNNMGTIRSLLKLQADSVTEPGAFSALKDAECRVQSMLLLYDRLYRSTGFTSLSLKSYLPELADKIIGNYVKNRAVKLEHRIDDITLDVKQLQSLGIIVNELLTNTVKYAFAGRSGGTVRLSAALSGKLVRVTVEDDGNGIPESVSFESGSGFGLQMVRTLTEQLDGRIRIEREHGTRIVLEFERTPDSPPRTA